MAVIGITCMQDEECTQVWLHRNYYRAVERVGGVPVLLPPLRPGPTVDRVVEFVDGLILAGGGDVDPQFFGEEPFPETGYIEPERDLFEISLARCALRAGLPVLGICRGMQVLNIACGGDIYQDISLIGGNRRFKHYQTAPRWYPTHEIYINPNTLLFKIIGDHRLRVNSFHHQVIRRLGKGLRAAAWSRDGIVEALEHDEAPFVLGVQFHPESMWQRYEVFLTLFEALNRAAESFRAEAVDHSVAKILHGKPGC